MILLAGLTNHVSLLLLVEGALFLALAVGIRVGRRARRSGG